MTGAISRKKPQRRAKCAHLYDTGCCATCYNGTMQKAPAKRKFRQFTVVIEQDEDGYYVATVPSLPSCYTQARTLEELAPRIREVIALCLTEQDAPRMKFIALEQVEVSA